jgi:hypothetical protein
VTALTPLRVKAFDQASDNHHVNNSGRVILAAGVGALVGFAPWTASAMASMSGPAAPAEAGFAAGGQCLTSSPPAPASPAQMGTIVATIPPTVFVHDVGGRLRVSTNTGQAPRPRDTFYDVSHHRVLGLGSAIRRAALTACS